MDTLQLEQLLVSQNPHWTHPQIWDESLRLKRDFFASHWDHLIKNRLILAISGPRRVGKSYLLKQFIAHLMKTKIAKAENILYVSFNTGFNEKDIISQIVNHFLQNFVAKDKNTKYIFLDELQFISLWPDQIKAIYDLETPIKFVITGSTSLFYRQKSKESLLGRLLKFSLGVLSFSEYLRFKNLERPITKAAFFESLPLLRREFRRYLLYGQLPEVVLNPGLDPREYLMNVSDQLINFDIPYFYTRLDRTLFSNLVRTLSLEIANEISVNRLAAGLESSRGTIGEYIRILEETGYFSLCYNSYFKKMRAKVSGTKKIYSLNTNLSLAVNNFDERYFNDSRVLGHYAENYAYLRLKEKGAQYYSDKKREIDFVAGDTAYEVKFGQINNADDYVEIARKLKKKLILLTENEFTQTTVFFKFPLYLL